MTQWPTHVHQRGRACSFPCAPAAIPSIRSCCRCAMRSSWRTSSSMRRYSRPRVCVAGGRGCACVHVRACVHVHMFGCVFCARAPGTLRLGCTCTVGCHVHIVHANLRPGTGRAARFVAAPHGAVILCLALHPVLCHHTRLFAACRAFRFNVRSQCRLPPPSRVRSTMSVLQRGPPRAVRSARPWSFVSRRSLPCLRQKLCRA